MRYTDHSRNIYTAGHRLMLLFGNPKRVEKSRLRALDKISIINSADTKERNANEQMQYQPGSEYNKLKILIST
jgi:hypothetical protein